MPGGDGSLSRKSIATAFRFSSSSLCTLPPSPGGSSSSEDGSSSNMHAGGGGEQRCELCSGEQRQQQGDLANEEVDYGWFAGDSVCTQHLFAEALQKLVQQDGTAAAATDGTRARGCTVESRVHRSSFLLSVKCFGCCRRFSWGIGGIRTVRTLRGRHAEFQVVASYGREVTVAWVRWTHFTVLAKEVLKRRWHTAVAAWEEVVAHQRIWRCLEAGYLQRKCLLLEHFLAEVLSDANDAQPLLDFVGRLTPSEPAH